MALYKIIDSNEVDTVQGNVVLATSTFKFTARNPSRIIVFDFVDVSGSLDGLFDDYYYYKGDGLAGCTGLCGYIDSSTNLSGDLNTGMPVEISNLVAGLRITAYGVPGVV